MLEYYTFCWYHTSLYFWVLVCSLRLRTLLYCILTIHTALYGQSSATRLRYAICSYPDVKCSSFSPNLALQFQALKHVLPFVERVPNSGFFKRILVMTRARPDSARNRDWIQASDNIHTHGLPVKSAWRAHIFGTK